MFSRTLHIRCTHVPVTYYNISGRVSFIIVEKRCFLPISYIQNTKDYVVGCFEMLFTDAFTLGLRETSDL